MMHNQQKVLCIGSMGKDIFLPIDPTQLPHDEHCSDAQAKWFRFAYGSKIHVEDRFGALGGCACNVSVGLSRLGISTSVCGNIGNDAEGRWIIEVLKNEHVFTEKICTVDGAKTDLSMILVDSTIGERTIFVNRDVGEKLVINAQDISGEQWCYMGSLYGENIRENMRVIHRALIEQLVKLAYNPGGNNIAHDTDVVLDLIHHAHVVFVNRSEARDIVAQFNLPHNVDDQHDEAFLIHTIRQHMKSDDGVVVLTDGRNGAWVYNGEYIVHTDVIAKKVCDATGAGDAFASGFFAGFLQGFPVEKCMQWGSANSDAVIDHYGAQEGLLLYNIIEKRSQVFVVKK
jgi:sugar/nucleoside kinase (ribokinase family)